MLKVQKVRSQAVYIDHFRQHIADLRQTVLDVQPIHDVLRDQTIPLIHARYSVILDFMNQNYLHAPPELTPEGVQSQHARTARHLCNALYRLMNPSFFKRPVRLVYLLRLCDKLIRA